MTLLLAMRLFCNPIGTLNDLPVCETIMFGKLFHQFFEWNGFLSNFHTVYFTTLVQAKEKLSYGVKE